MLTPDRSPTEFYNSAFFFFGDLTVPLLGHTFMRHTLVSMRPLSIDIYVATSQPRGNRGNRGNQDGDPNLKSHNLIEHLGEVTGRAKGQIVVEWRTYRDGFNKIQHILAVDPEKVITQVRQNAGGV